MIRKKIPTEFAPAERASQNELEHQISTVRDSFNTTEVYDSLPEIALILNKERQIVFCNTRLFEALEIREPMLVYGQRPGEVLNCIHARETEGGCGTTKSCSTCGAVLAILSAQQERKKDVRECRITCLRDGVEESLEFRVWTNPLDIAREHFIVFSVTNISDEKRRQVLEKIFFHDIRDTAGHLLHIAQLVKEKNNTFDREELSHMIYTLSQQLVSEIETQKELLAAEHNGLSLQLSTVDTGRFLENIFREYSNHKLARHITLKVSETACDAAMTTDRRLLSRVFGNMVKNALEASPPKENVTIGCDRSGDRVRFWVHNPGCIPQDTQLQIFQRSFSTKGHGRGIGTYSMKLLSERYLQGRVWFTSSPEQGTYFTAEYPLHLRPASLENANGVPGGLPEQETARMRPLVEEGSLAPLSPEHLSKLPEIIACLEGELMELWAAARHKQLFGEIGRFAEQLRMFGETYAIESVTQFGSDLLDAVNTFDIERIEAGLDAYPRLVDALRLPGERASSNEPE